MTDRYEYWKGHWESQSKVEDEIRASGWGPRSIKEYLCDISDICKKLELKSGDRLLNIGCGNGLMELVFSNIVSAVDGVDFSEGMIARARKNNENNTNARFYVGSILDLGFLDKRYDKVLCNSVIQYLNNVDEVAKSLKEIRRVCKDGARALIAANPDRSKMEEFLAGYDRLAMGEEEKEKKRAANRLSLWTDPSEILKAAGDAGFNASVLRMDGNVWQAWYMYDLLLSGRKHEARS